MAGEAPSQPVLRHPPIALDRANPAAALRTLEVDWTYRPSRRTARVRTSRLVRRIIQRRGPPLYRALVPVTPAGRWIAYFLFMPDGRVSDAHRYTLARLRSELGVKLLLIAAAPAPGPEFDELGLYADALYWKALSGFDFSAFAIAIHAVAAHSPGAELILLNDSVFGPFTSLTTFFGALPWDLAAITANAEVENHTQSYCWRVREVSTALVAGLRRVLSPDWAYDRFADVVLLQETRLARHAAACGTVGAKWFSRSGVSSVELTTSAPIELVEMGAPVLKRSLFGKFGHLHPRQSLLQILRRFDHPLPRSAA